MRSEDLLAEIFDARMAWFPLPAEVISFDSATQTATILPKVKIKGVEPKPVEGAKVILPAGGPWEVDLHLAVGDIVLAIFCGMDIAMWATGANADIEMEAPELHNAVVIGCLSRGAGRTAGTSPGVTIRNNSGTIAIEMTETGINIKANPGLVIFSGVKGTVGAFTHTHSGVTTGLGNSGPPVPGS